MSNDGKTTFKRWYDKHKEEFAARRKKRYAEDPVYREKVKGYAKKSKDTTPAPEGYDLTQVAVAKHAGVPYTAIIGWRSRNYLPEPKRHKNRALFTMAQADLVQSLAKYFAAGGKHGTPELQTITDNIFANW